MKVYGVIYLLIDGTNDFEYVGQTIRSVKRRFKQHAKCKTSYIGRAIQDHGEDMFVIAILKECYSKEELDFWEKHFIKYRDTKAPNGYNLTDGGDGGSGYSPSEETRAKLSAASSGENNPFFGKHHTAESLAKMSESHLGNTAWVGRNHRKESKVLMSVARRADSPFKNLLAEMDKRQFTYKDLADILGIPHTTLPPKMCGVKGFKAVEVAKLVEFFGLPAEYLFERDDGIPFSASKDSPFKNLLMEMDERNITYRELAKLLGFKNEASVSNKMYGKYNFTGKDIAKLVEIFEKPADYLMKRDDSEVCEKPLMARRYETPFKNLLAEISSRQLNYSSLGKFLNLSQQVISDKMHGKQNFTSEQVAKLVEIFGKPADYLMKRDDEEVFLSKKDSKTPFKNLLAEIYSRQLNYTSLGELLNLSQQAISYKMRDKQNFTSEQVAKLVEIFGKPADYLMKRDE
jgi:group I intron endonuclease